MNRTRRALARMNERASAIARSVANLAAARADLRRLRVEVARQRKAANAMEVAAAVAGLIAPPSARFRTERAIRSAMLLGDRAAAILAAQKQFRPGKSR